MDISQLTKYPVAYLAIIMMVYTAYDYIEHISRPGSIFEANPWSWLAFSLSALMSFLLVVLLLKHLFQKIFGYQNLTIELAAIGGWLLLYLTFLGPVFDWALWPHGKLNFNFSFGPFVVILFIYFVIRVVINMIAGQKLLYSKYA